MYSFFFFLTNNLYFSIPSPFLPSSPNLLQSGSHRPVLSMSLCLFCLFVHAALQTPHAGKITWCVSSSDWLISLSIMSSRSTHALDGDTFLKLNGEPRYYQMFFFHLHSSLTSYLALYKFYHSPESSDTCVHNSSSSKRYTHGDKHVCSQICAYTTYICVYICVCGYIHYTYIY